MFAVLKRQTTAPVGHIDSCGELNRPLAALMTDSPAGLHGLTSAEVAERLTRYGPNTLQRKQARHPLVHLISLIFEPLSIILMVAAVISAFAGETKGMIIIFIMVALSAVMQFVQEYRSEQTAQKLARQVALTATVIRDGVTAEIAMEGIVPGDLIRLGVGDIVPADARVLSAKDFFVDQAALTGESFPVEKSPCDEPSATMALTDMTHAVFFGTNVISGTATALVTATGSGTQFGRIAKGLSAERPETEFQKGVKEFTWLLIRVIGVLVATIFILNLSLKHGLFPSLLFAVAVSVGITPELLPMIMTINMSVGAAAMAKDKVIVKRLQSIQNLGSMDILCTDKTGTLTEGTLTVHDCIDVNGVRSPQALRLAQLNSTFQASMRNPMDIAIVAYQPESFDDYTKIDEIPFDFQRRRLSIVVAGDRQRYLITKGAPEGILEICDRIEIGDQTIELTPEQRQKVSDRFTAISAEGYRAVAVAYRPIGNGRTVYSLSDEIGLTFVGFVTFIDPPKTSALTSVQALHDLGVEVKILTGDNELVTQRICERVGIQVKGILNGRSIDSLSDEELAQQAYSATVCARLSPEQKNRIISVLKQSGHVVGYLGDGINDAPSLRNADVGISVNNAVDVAKEAADIVLLEEGLHTLKTGIVEGRRTFANTMKYIMMGTSSNFGNMFSVPVATLLVSFLPMRPVQILLNNLLYDVSQVTIPTDRVDDDYIERPKRWDIRFIRNFMVAFGPISSLYDVLTYMVMLYLFHANESVFQTGWFVESLATQTLVIHVIRSRHSIIHSKASLPVWLSTLGVVVAGAIIPYTRLGEYFGFSPLPLRFFGVLCLMVFTYLLMVEGMKQWFYRSAYGSSR